MPILPSTSFDVVATLDVVYGDRKDGAPLPTFKFTSYFEPAEDGYTFVSAVGGMGEAQRYMTFVEMGLSGFEGSFAAGTVIMPTAEYNEELDVREASVTPTDDDGDGVADSFSAIVRGRTVAQTGGDVVQELLEFTLELQGSKDETPPKLTLPRDAGRFHPMSDFSLWATEALSPDSSVTLLGDPELPLTHTARGRGARGTLLELGTGKLSWFSREWTIEASGGDLSGSPLLQSATIRTLEDPGIFPQDGFEGPLVADGGGKIVEENAISGARSLTLATFEPVTLHLTRNASGSVRFSFREELFPWHLDGEEEPILLRARALVVGTQSVVTYEGEHSAFDPGATLGSVVHAEIPLEAPGDDVIVTFDWHSDACTENCSPADVMIDDLRIE